MFSLSNDAMNKMTEDNPILAMMQTAFANDNERVKKTAEAWLKAIPEVEGLPNSGLATHPMAAMAASSAVGFGLYTQMFGTMMGAMTGAMEAAEKMKEATEKSEAPFGMLFNPLTFEWSDVNSAEKPATKASKPKKAAVKAPSVTPTQVVESNAETITERAAAPIEKPEKVLEAERTAIEKAMAKPVFETPAPAIETTPVASPAEIMPEDFKKPKKMEKPEAPDDLKQISGIGPKLEQVLNSMGIWSFSQIEAWTPEEVAWVDDFLQFKGRIDRDEWIAQASKLAKV